MLQLILPILLKYLGAPARKKTWQAGPALSSARNASTNDGTPLAQQNDFAGRHRSTREGQPLCV